MVAILGTLFFTAVLGIAIWSIVETVRPRMGRIVFLLQYGPVIGTPLPPVNPRVTVRGRNVPLRMQVPARLRAAA
ncbi:hypothetical protein P1X14_01835 [Sphingomonas sp. AOB5]|uniref:hypothetical protein n=1 Tax=Sphingomonas sp. AOB5 TaxID=3034017 RepID=UPI0023F7221D|nr:hypothetical protein [Sphingomonas sp. AOB5]MDF7773973.1 hypothetical protein [Sphingomonas sp. AOB5]